MPKTVCTLVGKNNGNSKSITWLKFFGNSFKLLLTYQSLGLVCLQMLFHGVLVGSVVVEVVKDPSTSFLTPDNRTVLDFMTVLVATPTLLAIVAHLLLS